MGIPVQSFGSMVQQMAAAVQGGATQLIDLTVGSVLRAILESCASVAIWLQWLVLLVLASTRAATSVGSDLDSWMADFSLARLPGAASVGVTTFSRFSVGIAATVPVGCIVLTQDLMTQFAVTADPTNASWNGLNGYTLPAVAMSIDVPIQAQQIGIIGNVLAGAISVIASPIPGIDQVSNALATIGGLAAESDAAFRQRFVLYINSLSLATNTAIEFAVATVQPGTRYVLLENQTVSGGTQLGNFCVILDDGSGSPPATLLAAASAAVTAVRPIGSTYVVSGPVVVQASISMSISTNNSGTYAAVAAAIELAIRNWIFALPIGGVLAISKLESIAHDTDQSVVSVSNTLINGSNIDLGAGSSGVIIASTIVVS